MAQGAFDASYFGNDIYEVFDAAYKTICPGWKWGPNWDITNTALKDAYGKLSTGGTISGGSRHRQTATIDGPEAKRPVHRRVAIHPARVAAAGGNPAS